jgi:multicomponent Na+:H+ antiporter subunit A
MGWIFAAPFLLAIAAPWLHRAMPHQAGRLLALLIAGLFAVIWVTPDQPEPFVFNWVPSLDISLSFLFDGLGKLMALIITGIGALILLYGGSYLHGDPRLPRLYATLLGFMGSMLGVALGGNLLFIFVCWELTSITSFVLIGFDHHRAEARAAALQSLLVTALGGLSLLAGVVMLGQMAGSYELYEIAKVEALGDHTMYLPALILILLGAFTKSAQVPFHFWLPGAMQAPTPVSAYLHSATMVKAGVFLLARLNGSIGGTDEWMFLLITFGGITMLLGNLVALTRTDLKQILAYSTVGMLGTLTMLIGVGTPIAAASATALLVAHALYKGGLFMVAGILDHETGTRDSRVLSGLGRALPFTFAGAALAAFSCMGVIPLFGFIAKEKSYLTLIQAPHLGLWLVAAGVLANAAVVSIAAITGLRPFLGKEMQVEGEPQTEPQKEPHEAPVDMWIGPLLLGGFGLVLGIFAGAPIADLLERAAAGLHGQPIPFELKLWAGLEGDYGLAIGLSVLTLALGAVMFYWRSIGLRAAKGLDRVAPIAPASIYQRTYTGSLKGAEMLTRRVQNGLLNTYLRIIVVTLIALSLYSIYRQPDITLHTSVADIQAHEIGVIVVVVVGVLVAVLSRSRMLAVASLGVIGLGVTLFYAFFSAPDLAMTQIMVETLMVLLFVLVFFFLPRYAQVSSRYERLRDLAVSVMFGALMTVMVLAATGEESFQSRSEYYAEQSVPGGHGRNVVNVILVDFRSLDTLGEVTVLVAAGLGVVAMLKLRPSRREEDEE